MVKYPPYFVSLVSRGRERGLGEGEGAEVGGGGLRERGRVREGGGVMEQQGKSRFHTKITSVLSLTCFSYNSKLFKHFFFFFFFLVGGRWWVVLVVFLNSFVHSHATLMVCLRANFLLTTLKYYLIHYDFPPVVS